MRLCDLQSRPDLNGLIVEVLRPNGEGRWVVALFRNDIEPQFTVATGKLERLRPEA